ncbi:Esterase EstB [compost metagenome]
MKSLAIFTAGILLCLPMSGWSGIESPAPETKPDVVGDFIEFFILKHNIPGASISITHNGQVAYEKGVGVANIETSSPVVSTTPFRIASVSKPITAVAIFKLLEDSGKDIQAALDMPVFGANGYLPDFAEIKDNDIYKIRLRDLLQHTGGWNSQFYDPQFDLYNIAVAMGTTPPADAPTVIRYMLKFRDLDVAPGTEYHYSNFGYNILGRVVEKLSGQPYDQYVRTHVLLPLGVDQMQIGGSRMEDLLPNESRYYDDPRTPLVPSIYDGVTLGPQAYVGFSCATMDSHGGWIATPTELVKFINGVTPGSGSVQILKEDTIQIMTAPVLGIGNDQTSLGWVVEENGAVIAHAGALESSTLSYLIRRSDGVTWAVTFNRLPIGTIDDIGPLMQELTSNMDLLIRSIDEWP